MLYLQANTYTDKTAAIAETERLTLNYGGKLLDFDAPSGLGVIISVRIPGTSVRQWVHELSALGINFAEDSKEKLAELESIWGEQANIVLHLNFMGSSSGFGMPGPFA